MHAVWAADIFGLSYFLYFCQSRPQARPPSADRDHQVESHLAHVSLSPPQPPPPPSPPAKQEHEDALFSGMPNAESEEEVEEEEEEEEGRMTQSFSAERPVSDLPSTVERAASATNLGETSETRGATTPPGNPQRRRRAYRRQPEPKRSPLPQCELSSGKTLANLFSVNASSPGDQRHMDQVMRSGDEYIPFSSRGHSFSPI